MKPGSKVDLPVGVLNNLRRRCSSGGDLYGTRIAKEHLRAQYPGTTFGEFKLVLAVLRDEGLVAPPRQGMGLVIGPQL